MSARTTNRPEATVRPFLFENVSGEEIPAFAAMQMVGDPKGYAQYLLSDPQTSVFEKESHKIFGPPTLFDNELKLFCSKPTSTSEFFQDASRIAFNGPAPVAKGGSGRCHWDQFPAKSLVTNGAIHSVSASLKVVRDSWALKPIGSPSGAFKGLLALEERVSATEGIAIINKPAYPPQKNPLWATGTWKTESKPNDPFPLKITRSGTDATGYHYDSGLAIGSLPSLRLLVPGTYTIRLEGVVERADGTPESLTSVPYRIALVPWSGNAGIGSSQIWSVVGSQIPFARENLARVLISTGPDVYVMETHQFRLVDSFRVTKPVYIIGLQQTLSPFVKAQGTFSVEYNYQQGVSDRFVFNESYFGNWYQNGLFGGYGGYGYFGYGGYGYYGYQNYLFNGVKLRPGGASEYFSTYAS